MERLRPKYKVIYKNGEEFSKEKVEEKVLKEAQDQIVLVGTYVAPQATQKPQLAVHPLTLEEAPPAVHPREATMARDYRPIQVCLQNFLR